jgi:hypothetical protein
MTIYRLANGDLVLYSAVAMDEAGMKALEALGKPAVLVVPHPFHIMDAPFYARRYPDMRVLAADDAKARMGDGVRVHDTPDRALPELGIETRTVPGYAYTEIELLLGVEGGKALVVTDLIGNSGEKPPLFMRVLGPPGGIGVPRIVKFRQVRDKPKAREFIRGLSAIEGLKMVALSHGAPLLSDCATHLENSAARV